MTLNEYLRTRHETINALTRAEAKVVGIKFPLVRGWVEKYGCLELPDEVVDKLKAARDERYKQESYKKAKAKNYKRKENAVKKKSEHKPVLKLKRESKKIKRERKNSLTKLVKTIVAQGCSDIERLNKHLNKPHNSSAIRKLHSDNMQHMKSI